MADAPFSNHFGKLIVKCILGMFGSTNCAGLAEILSILSKRNFKYKFKNLN